jgi:plastocyanin
MTDDRPTPRPRESLLLPIVIPLAILAVIAVVLWTFSRVLLHVEPHVATATALVMAAAIVAIVAIAASRKRVGNGALLSVAVGVAGVGMLASGAALLLGTPTAEGGGGPPVTVALTAPAGAAAKGFAEKQLSAPADEAFTIAFDNQDASVTHDVVVASADPTKDPTAQTFLDGTVITGVAQTSYPVPALPEGSYYYFCKIHPTTMYGDLTVAPGAPPGGPGGGGSTTITASGLQFDTDTLTFPANSPISLLFQNNDAGVPHNFSIYTDDSAKDSLFKGDIVTGVASTTYDIKPLKPGSYLFRCDVHTDMTGTVTVEPGGEKPPPGGESPPASGGAPPPGATTVTASGLTFDVPSISLPAGQPSTITFDNEDAGVQHNIAIYTDESATKALFQGDPVTGVATQDYHVDGLDPGSYYFRCDFHPESMHGTVNVG